MLTNTQISNLRKAFATNFADNKNLSKTKLHKMAQSENILGRILEPLLKTALPLMDNVLKPLV